MYRLFTLGLSVLLSTIIQPVLSLPVEGPSLFQRNILPAHAITNRHYHGHPDVPGKHTYTSIVHHNGPQSPAQMEFHARNAYHQAHVHALANGHHQHEPFIMAGLHVPPDAHHPFHTSYFASIPKGAGNAFYKAHPEQVHAGDHNFMHAETHALALAHADGRRPGPGSYMAVHGNHANGLSGELSPCSTPGRPGNCENALRAHQIGFGRQSTHRSGAPSPEHNG